MKIKICECNTPFIPKGPAGKYCPVCAQKKKAESRRREYVKRCASKGIRIDVGTGNRLYTPKGADHPCYSSGKGEYVRARKELLETIGACERCGKDLRDASPHHRVVHHRDHDRRNNSKDNFELLCKRCHQLEHNCIQNLKNV